MYTTGSVRLVWTETGILLPWKWGGTRNATLKTKNRRTLKNSELIEMEVQFIQNNFKVHYNENYLLRILIKVPLQNSRTLQIVQFLNSNQKIIAYNNTNLVTNL